MNKNMTKAQLAAENEMLRSQLEAMRLEQTRRDEYVTKLHVTIQKHERAIGVLTDKNDGLEMELDALHSKREATPPPKALLQSAREYALTNHVLTRVHNGRVQSHTTGGWRNV